MRGCDRSLPQTTMPWEVGGGRSKPRLLRPPCTDSLPFRHLGQARNTSGAQAWGLAWGWGLGTRPEQWCALLAPQPSLSHTLLLVHQQVLPASQPNRSQIFWFPHASLVTSRAQATTPSCPLSWHRICLTASTACPRKSRQRGL